MTSSSSDQGIAPRVARVLNGYITLSTDDRAAFMREVERYRQGTSAERARLTARVTARAGGGLGATDDRCTCCGR